MSFTSQELVKHPRGFYGLSSSDPVHRGVRVFWGGTKQESGQNGWRKVPFSPSPSPCISSVATASPFSRSGLRISPYHGMELFLQSSNFISQGREPNWTQFGQIHKELERDLHFEWMDHGTKACLGARYTRRTEWDRIQFKGTLMLTCKPLFYLSKSLQGQDDDSTKDLLVTWTVHQHSTLWFSWKEMYFKNGVPQNSIFIDLSEPNVCIASISFPKPVSCQLPCPHQKIIRPFSFSFPHCSLDRG